MDGPGKPVDPNSDVPEQEPHDGNREQLTLFSNFTPLVLSTMTKYSTSDESYTVSMSTCIACIAGTGFFRVKEEISRTREGEKERMLLSPSHVPLLWSVKKMKNNYNNNNQHLLCRLVHVQLYGFVKNGC